MIAPLVCSSHPSFSREGVTLALIRSIRDISRNHARKTSLGNSPSQYTTEDVNSFVLKPMTKSLQTSVVNMLKIGYRDIKHPELGLCYSEAVTDRATVFVSHAWRYTFDEVVEALEIFYEEHSNEDVSFWFDALIVDQWNAPSLPYDWWSGTFLNAIGDIGHTLFLLFPWNNPITLTRAWCLW